MQCDGVGASTQFEKLMNIWLTASPILMLNHLHTIFMRYLLWQASVDCIHNGKFMMCIRTTQSKFIHKFHSTHSHTATAATHETNDLQILRKHFRKIIKSNRAFKFFYVYYYFEADVRFHCCAREPQNLSRTIIESTKPDITCIQLHASVVRVSCDLKQNTFLNH